MDSPRSVQPISGSIPSKQVSNGFLAKTMVSTKSTHPVHILTLLDSGSSSCFMDRKFAQASKISLRKLPCPTCVVVIDGRPIASKNIVEDWKGLGSGWVTFGGLGGEVGAESTREWVSGGKDCNQWASDSSWNDLSVTAESEVPSTGSERQAGGRDRVR